jgi:hypothetical protein
LTISLEIYKQALDDIDAVNRKLASLFSGVFLSDLQQFLADMIRDRTNLDTHVLNMNRRMNSRIVEVNEIMSTFYGRLDKVRLVASQQTLKLLDEYREISTRAIAAQSELTNSINLPKSTKELSESGIITFNKDSMEKLGSVQQRWASIREKLEMQMRKDVGYK